MTTHNPRLLSAGSINGNTVRNTKGEELGKIEEVMLDIHSGAIGYAVVSHGGILGMGDKLFAVPWKAFSVDTKNHEMVLDAPKERMENAPGFNKDNWPNFADPTWAESIHSYYLTTPVH